ncbi:MAG: hypothetical protein EOL88_13585 [Bacteroidia bacterium]|nr:hypothetical protein [Bacteroidia bacterium]
MKKLMPYILAFTMLVAGFFVGIFTAGQITRNKIQEFSKMRSPEGMHQDLIRELELSPAQQETLEVIFREHSEKIRALTLDFRKEFDAEIQRFKHSIAPTLEPWQLERFEQREKRLKYGFDRRRNLPPGDRPGRFRPHEGSERPHNQCNEY